MTEINDRVKNYITQLPQMGLVYLVSGVVLLAVLFKVTVSDPAVNVPFGILGVALGYYLVSYVDPGGRVNFWFFSSVKLTEDQKTLYDLVVKYKSRIGIILTNIVFCILISLFDVSHYNAANIFNINNIVFLVFWTAITSLTLSNGVKYISAWRNIERNLK